ncbi:MAG TPA: hypothetical protein VGP16_19725 [Asanoa sp.]|nr:hypothetical protein [Asanoa sp.]
MLTSTSAASMGIATAKATTLIFADRSSDGSVMNGCTRIRPIPISPA